MASKSTFGLRKTFLLEQRNKTPLCGAAAQRGSYHAARPRAYIEELREACREGSARVKRRPGRRDETGPPWLALIQAPATWPWRRSSWESLIKSPHARRKHRPAEVPSTVDLTCMLAVEGLREVICPHRVQHLELRGVRPQVKSRMPSHAMRGRWWLPAWNWGHWMTRLRTDPKRRSARQEPGRVPRLVVSTGCSPTIHIQVADVQAGAWA